MMWKFFLALRNLDLYVRKGTSHLDIQCTLWVCVVVLHYLKKSHHIPCSLIWGYFVYFYKNVFSFFLCVSVGWTKAVIFFCCSAAEFFVVVGLAKTAKGYSSLAFELFFSFFRQHRRLRGHMFLCCLDVIARYAKLKLMLICKYIFAFLK